jgi:hypothetical protein
MKQTKKKKYITYRRTFQNNGINMLIDRREYKTFRLEKVVGIGDIAQGRVSFGCSAPDLHNVQDLVFNIQIATSLTSKSRNMSV